MRRSWMPIVVADALVAAAILVTLIEVPFGGGALPCRVLSDRVDAALQRDFNRLPLLRVALYDGQYQQDQYALVRKVRSDRNGLQCLLKSCSAVICAERAQALALESTPAPRRSTARAALQRGSVWRGTGSWSQTTSERRASSSTRRTSPPQTGAGP